VEGFIQSKRKWVSEVWTLGGNGRQGNGKRACEEGLSKKKDRVQNQVDQSHDSQERPLTFLKIRRGKEI